MKERPSSLIIKEEKQLNKQVSKISSHHQTPLILMEQSIAANNEK